MTKYIVSNAGYGLDGRKISYLADFFSNCNIVLITIVTSNNTWPAAASIKQQICRFSRMCDAKQGIHSLPQISSTRWTGDKIPAELVKRQRRRDYVAR